MAEITDEELARLQLGAKQAEALAGEVQTLKTQYERDVGGLNTYAQGLLQQIQSQSRPSSAGPEPDDDDLFVDDPKKLKAQIQSTVKDSLSSELQPVPSGYYTTQFETQMSLARADASMPHFAKWEKEVRAYFQGQPQYALVPGMIGQVYNLVKTQHFDELLHEAVQQRQAAPTEEEEEESVVSVPAASPARTVAAPVPVSQGAGAPVLPTKKRVRLTDDEQVVAGEYGMTAEEYRLYQNEDAGPDIYGLIPKRA